MQPIKFLTCLYCEIRYCAKKITSNLFSEKDKEELKKSLSKDSDAFFALEANQRREIINFLKENIKKFPYWARGHLEYARHSILAEDIASAYASVQAVQLLSKNEKIRFKAGHLLGKCYLKKGLHLEAIKVLKELAAAEPENILLKEDLAAAFMASGSYSDAYSVLKQIPENNLSSEAGAVLRFLKTKEQ